MDDSPPSLMKSLLLSYLRKLWDLNYLVTHNTIQCYLLDKCPKFSAVSLSDWGLKTVVMPINSSPLVISYHDYEETLKFINQFNDIANDVLPSFIFTLDDCGKEIFAKKDEFIAIIEDTQSIPSPVYVERCSKCSPFLFAASADGYIFCESNEFIKLSSKSPIHTQTYDSLIFSYWFEHVFCSELAKRKLDKSYSGVTILLVDIYFSELIQSVSSLCLQNNIQTFVVPSSVSPHILPLQYLINDTFNLLDQLLKHNYTDSDMLSYVKNNMVKLSPKNIMDAFLHCSFEYDDLHHKIIINKFKAHDILCSIPGNQIQLESHESVQTENINELNEQSELVSHILFPQITSTNHSDNPRFIRQSLEEHHTIRKSETSNIPSKIKRNEVNTSQKNNIGEDNESSSYINSQMEIDTKSSDFRERSHETTEESDFNFSDTDNGNMEEETQTQLNFEENEQKYIEDDNFEEPIAPKNQQPKTVFCEEDVDIQYHLKLKEVLQSQEFLELQTVDEQLTFIFIKCNKIPMRQIADLFHFTYYYVYNVIKKKRKENWKNINVLRPLSSKAKQKFENQSTYSLDFSTKALLDMLNQRQVITENEASIYFIKNLLIPVEEEIKMYCNKVICSCTKKEPQIPSSPQTINEMISSINKQLSGINPNFIYSFDHYGGHHLEKVKCICKKNKSPQNCIVDQFSKVENVFCCFGLTGYILPFQLFIEPNTIHVYKKTIETHALKCVESVNMLYTEDDVLEYFKNTIVFALQSKIRTQRYRGKSAVLLDSYFEGFVELKKYCDTVSVQLIYIPTNIASFLLPTRVMFKEYKGPYSDYDLIQKYLEWVRVRNNIHNSYKKCGFSYIQNGGITISPEVVNKEISGQHLNTSIDLTQNQNQQFVKTDLRITPLPKRKLSSTETTTPAVKEIIVIEDSSEEEELNSDELDGLDLNE